MFGSFPPVGGKVTVCTVVMVEPPLSVVVTMVVEVGVGVTLGDVIVGVVVVGGGGGVVGEVVVLVVSVVEGGGGGGGGVDVADVVGVVLLDVFGLAGGEVLVGVGVDGVVTGPFVLVVLLDMVNI